MSFQLPVLDGAAALPHQHTPTKVLPLYTLVWEEQASGKICTFVFVIIVPQKAVPLLLGMYIAFNCIVRHILSVDP